MVLIEMASSRPHSSGPAYVYLLCADAPSHATLGSRLVSVPRAVPPRNANLVQSAPGPAFRTAESRRFRLRRIFVQLGKPTSSCLSMGLYKYRDRDCDQNDIGYYLRQKRPLLSVNQPPAKVSAYSSKRPTE
jgi:hypothetical protein